MELPTHLPYDDPDQYQEPEFTGPWSVAVYLVDKSYGGPEEGGWWFTHGEPVYEKDLPLPLMFWSEEEALEVADQWRGQIDQLNVGRRSISSVLSEGEYRVVVLEGPARPWPEQRPHYE